MPSLPTCAPATATAPIVIHSTDYSPIKRTDLALRAFAAPAAGSPNGAAPRLLVTSTREDARAQRELAELARSLRSPTGGVPRVPPLRGPAALLLDGGRAAPDRDGRRSGATTMSLPVKEALACGTAGRALGRDGRGRRGRRERLPGGSADSETTGARLATMLGDRAQAHAMGEAGRKRITSTYNWDRVVDVVEQSLEPR